MDPPTIALTLGLALAVLTLALLMRRWIHAPSREVERYIQRLRAGEHPVLKEWRERRDWDYEIRLQAQGFAVVPLADDADDTESPVSLTWDLIVEATAYKLDLWSADRVCIGFGLLDGSCIEVHEEMKGWIDLCETLPDQLPGTPPWTAWFMNITTPAFETNPTPLFRRDESTPHAPKQAKGAPPSEENFS